MKYQKDYAQDPLRSKEPIRGQPQAEQQVNTSWSFFLRLLFHQRKSISASSDQERFEVRGP